MANLTDIITPTNLVTKTGSDTLTNKTLTSPTITNLTATGTFTLGGTALTSTATELNVLDGIPAGLTSTELGYVDGVTSSIQTQINSLGGPTFDAVASGTISNGDTVIINTDGTVSAIAGTGAVENLGTAVDYSVSAAAFYTQGCYDTTADRVVVVYYLSGQTYCKVGQVTGTDIAFGAATQVGTGGAYPDICYDANANRIIVCYRPSNNYLTVAVGTVTGGGTNTISFGTPVAANSTASFSVSVVYLAATNKVVLMYKETDGKCMCGTTDASSETMTFGAEETFSSGSVDYMERGAFYDSDTERVVVCYGDSSNDGKACLIANTTGTTLVAYTAVTFESGEPYKVAGCYDTAQNKGVVIWVDHSESDYLKSMALTIVGGVTNSITLGAEVIALSASSQHCCTTFDATAGKVVALYKNTSVAGEVNAGTVSGTGASATITWDTGIVVDSSYLEYPGIAYDPDAGKTILLYSSGSNSEHGYGQVYTVAYGSTNLTAENYIGISNAAYSSSATATIQVVGSVDDAQTSLTVGQTYYISFDGSLVLTPIVPSVVAGTAVSATKLIVKG